MIKKVVIDWHEDFYIELYRGGKVRVNMRKTTLPFLHSGVLMVQKIGVNVVVRTSFGGVVLYDGDSRLQIGLPGSFKGKTEGKYKELVMVI